jgi:hypothetical protein
MCRFGALAGVVAVATAMGLGAVARASVLAYDDASSPAYNSGWTNSTNGGSGFAPWVLLPQQSGNGGGHFIGTSANNGDGGGQAPPPGDIDVAGESWGMYANGGTIAEARRAFNGALSVGQHLQFRFDNGWIDTGGSVLIILEGAEDRLGFRFEGGLQNYELDDNTGSVDTGIPFTDEGMLIDFSLATPDTYVLSVAPNGGTLRTFTGPLMGTAGVGIDAIHFFNGSAGPFSQRDMFVNSLAIVPEPAAALGVAAMTIMLRRRGSPR